MGGIAWRTVGALVVAGQVLLWAPGCMGPECGPGTREADGLCVPMSYTGSDGGIHCGENTVLLGTECVPSEEICGPNTTVESELDDAGVPTGGFVCVGQAVDEGEPPPPCPEEFGPAGEICINGYAHWLMDDNEAVFMANLLGDPDAAEDATHLVVKVYDPLLYAQDPENTVPLGWAEVNPRWGTFRVLNVSVPGTGFVALALDDLDEDQANIYTMTGVPYVAVANQHLEYVAAFGITNDQVTAWTEAVGGAAMLESIGCPEPAGGGPRTMATCGTWIGVYVDSEPIESINPVEGTLPFEPGGIIPEAKTFYPGIDGAGNLVFDDPTPGVVWSDEEGPHEWSGQLGAVFYPTSSMGNMTGECAPQTPCEEAGCIFMEFLGGSVPEAFFVQFMLPATCQGG